MGLKELTPYSIKIYMTYLGGFFKFLYKNDMVNEDPTRKTPGVKVPKKDVVYIPHDEILKELDQMLSFSESSLHSVVFSNRRTIR